MRIDAIVTLITRHSGPRGGIQIPVCLCCALWIVTAKKKKRQARDVSAQGSVERSRDTAPPRPGREIRGKIEYATVLQAYGLQSDELSKPRSTASPRE